MSAEDPLAIEPREPPAWALASRSARRRRRRERWVWDACGDGVRRRHDIKGREAYFIRQLEVVTGREWAYRD